MTISRVRALIELMPGIVQLFEGREMTPEEKRGLEMLHPLWPLWNSMRHSGKKMIRDWRNSFYTFITDVGEAPGPDYILVRPKPQKPMGRMNFEWRKKDAP